MPELPEEAVKALKERWPPRRRNDGKVEDGLPAIATEAAELVIPAIQEVIRKRLIAALGFRNEKVAPDIDVFEARTQNEINIAFDSIFKEPPSLMAPECQQEEMPSHTCRHCGYSTEGLGGSVLQHKPECLLRREAERAIEKTKARAKARPDG